MNIPIKTLVYRKDKESVGYTTRPEVYSFKDTPVDVDAALDTLTFVFEAGGIERTIEQLLEDKSGIREVNWLYLRIEDEFVIIGDILHMCEPWITMKKTDLINFLSLWLKLAKNKADQITLSREEGMRFTISGNGESFTAPFEEVESEHIGGSCCQGDEDMYD